MPNYNNIAWIYDRLAKIVFGRKQELAMRAFLREIPQNSKVLVVGGGTGKIINYLGDLKKQLDVDFVEQSANMIRYAKKMEASHLKVNFYHQSILDFNRTEYDVILTNFFFDQFSQARALLFLQHLKPKLRANGKLIFSDFINTNHIWDKLVTHLMFYFFRLTANIRTSRFPPYNLIFSALGFYTVSSKKTSRNIVATTYSLVLTN
jgi:2-polyprenyl-3-methyl-5-hydroxy-6-metoxy-1,4-benzoquinol methylase